MPTSPCCRASVVDTAGPRLLLKVKTLASEVLGTWAFVKLVVVPCPRPCPLPGQLTGEWQVSRGLTPFPQSGTALKGQTSATLGCGNGRGCYWAWTTIHLGLWPALPLTTPWPTVPWSTPRKIPGLPGSQQEVSPSAASSTPVWGQKMRVSKEADSSPVGPAPGIKTQETPFPLPLHGFLDQVGILA